MNRPFSRRVFAVSHFFAAIAASSIATGQALDFRVHDPVMAKEGSTYYLFYTGNGVPIAKSGDLKNWERAGEVFDTAPAWTADAFPPRRGGRAGAAQGGREGRGRRGRGRGRRGRGDAAAEPAAAGSAAAGSAAARSAAGNQSETPAQPADAAAQEGKSTEGNQRGGGEGGGRGDGGGGRGGPRNNQWAPDIAFHNGTYYLYYSVSSFGSNNSAIGVATNKTLDPASADYKWTDHGRVVQSVAGRDLWNAIDPNLAFDENGTPWLSFGSYWSGIKLVKLNANLTEVAQPEQWYTLAGRDRYWKLEETDAGDVLSGAIEAPFIFKKGDYYYLFVSWDRCCQGANSTYKVVVGRSKNIIGPYFDKEAQDMRFGGGSLVVGGNADWPGVGHSATYTLDGQDYLVFHGYNAKEEGRSQLWIEEVTWDADGWPSVSLK
jgi:arabinan endo-1,5-alpha-L-arabinosidase